MELGENLKLGEKNRTLEETRVRLRQDKKSLQKTLRKNGGRKGSKARRP